MDIILEATELKYPGKNVHFHPDKLTAFSHLDSNPFGHIGEMASYSIYTGKDLLILTSTSKGFTRKFYSEQWNELKMSDLPQIKKNLYEMILPFTKLERSFPKTEKYQKLDEENIEMLKSLGYIE